MLLILLVVLDNAIRYLELVKIDEAYISYLYAENLPCDGQPVENLSGTRRWRKPCRARPLN